MNLRTWNLPQQPAEVRLDALERLSGCQGTLPADRINKRQDNAGPDYREQIAWDWFVQMVYDRIKARKGLERLICTRLYGWAGTHAPVMHIPD